MKTWTRAQIENLLNTNPIFVERSIVQLFKRQTEDEKQVNNATHNNYRGFNKPDARRMTIYAKSIIKRRKERVEGQRLDEWQMLDAQKRVMKYAGQLAKIANMNEVEKAQTHMEV